jgi:hypothetical protein
MVRIRGFRGGNIVVGADVGVQAGAMLSGALGESYSFVHIFGGWFSTNAAHVAWDLLAPSGLAIQYWIGKAKAAHVKSEVAALANCTQ